MADFTKFASTLKISVRVYAAPNERSQRDRSILMAATGELIRLINYVDDITTTLRRISASIPMMDEDERKRLAEHMRTASGGFTTVLNQLEKGT